MLDEETREEHPTYGLVGFSRVSHGPKGINLFGSSISHHTTISLRICRAEKQRSLSRDWYFGKARLIEVSMSPTQFAEAITCMNVGDGVPCTLQNVSGKDQGECPEINQRQIFTDEIKEDVKKAMVDATALARQAREVLLKKNPTVSDRKQVIEMLDKLEQHIISNMPFVHKQFDEAMDKTVNEAKGEVEAFFLRKIHSLGLNALQDQSTEIPQIPAICLEHHD
jgi:hypothetical protein